MEERGGVYEALLAILHYNNAAMAACRYYPDGPRTLPCVYFPWKVVNE